MSPKKDPEEEYVEILERVRNTSSGLLLNLPSAPHFMCILQTKKGKPIGYPIWKTFEHKEGVLSLENETISSTLLSLAKNLKALNADPNTSTVIRITSGNQHYNFYLPSWDDHAQFCFVVAFEKNPKVNLSDEDREDLVLSIVKRLKQNEELMEIVSSPSQIQKEIKIGTPLYQRILQSISETIVKWDKTRVKYLEKSMKKERDRLVELSKQIQMKDNEQELMEQSKE